MYFFFTFESLFPTFEAIKVVCNTKKQNKKNLKYTLELLKLFKPDIKMITRSKDMLVLILGLPILLPGFK